ncbi:helix-turn-helix domain-containing protein [Sulfurovum sp. CS9]|uniref:helix-turn-helix domain-containing protein n=1 Tax=Sulfurovum sp. CS9 TaxID=3391146 RepID=UPI0039E9FD07
MLNQHLQELEANKKLLRETYKRSLINKEEAARELGGISTETVDRMRRNGEIESKQVRGQIKFSITEIARFM